jgi:hypothetical protein
MNETLRAPGSVEEQIEQWLADIAENREDRTEACLQAGADLDWVPAAVEKAKVKRRATQLAEARKAREEYRAKEVAKAAKEQTVNVPDPEPPQPKPQPKPPKPEEPEPEEVKPAAAKQSAYDRDMARRKALREAQGKPAGASNGAGGAETAAEAEPDAGA